MATTAPELLDRRVLAALRFVDANGQQVLSRVDVTGTPPVAIRRNRRGLAVIVAAAGLESHLAAFDAPPPGPAPAIYTLDIVPRDSALAARRFGLSLPRDPDPANAEAATSLFQPVDIELLPSSAAIAAGQTAIIRVTVTRSDDGRLVEGALVRLATAGNALRARAVTGCSGEAALLLAGLPLSIPGAGATVRSDQTARLTAIIDPLLARFHAPGATAAAGPAIDPDDLETRLAAQATAPLDVQVAAGRTTVSAIQWSPP